MELKNDHFNILDLSGKKINARHTWQLLTKYVWRWRYWNVEQSLVSSSWYALNWLWRDSTYESIDWGGKPRTITMIRIIKTIKCDRKDYQIKWSWAFATVRLYLLLQFQKRVEACSNKLAILTWKWQRWKLPRWHPNACMFALSKFSSYKQHWWNWNSNSECLWKLYLNTSKQKRKGPTVYKKQL